MITYLHYDLFGSHIPSQTQTQARTQAIDKSSRLSEAKI